MLKRIVSLYPIIKEPFPFIKAVFTNAKQFEYCEEKYLLPNRLLKCKLLIIVTYSLAYCAMLALYWVCILSAIDKITIFSILATLIVMITVVLKLSLEVSSRILKKVIPRVCKKM